MIFNERSAVPGHYVVREVSQAGYEASDSVSGQIGFILVPDSPDQIADFWNQPDQGLKPIPEFSSAILPLTLIIGFLGAVLLLQRTREH